MTPASRGNPSTRAATARVPGFALVVTLSLMILLTVVAVGLLTLSAVSLRSSAQSSEMAIARSNARMAMMLAVGELQKYAGPDTRITARADILDDKNPPVLGVWESWKGDDHGSNGRPIAPDYSNHKEARFRAWLTSASQNARMAGLPDTKSSADGKVTLVGEKTVGKEDADKRQIHLIPTNVAVDKSRGTFAWWVSGENQKARLPRPYAPAAGNAATWSVLAKTHATADTQPFGLDELLTDSSLKDPAMPAPAGKALSIKQTDLLGAGGPSTVKLSRESFHDLSTNSVGLLTNTATGGWRKDLSLVTDNWGSLSASNLPFFRLNPAKDLLYTRPENDAMAAKSLLYHWADYRKGATGNVPIYSFPAICSWSNLANYATLYKNIGAASATSSMAVTPQASIINDNSNQGIYNFAHKVRILPLIARVQWVFCHKAAPSATSGKYDLNVIVQPVVTMWNPYNVTISSVAPWNSLTFTLQTTLPPVIDYKVDGASLPKKFTLIGDSDPARNSLTTYTTSTLNAIPLTGPISYTLANVPPFAPGETRIFSPKDASNNLVPGYFPQGGVSYSVAKGVGANGSSKISTNIRFDAEYKDAGAEGVGLYLNMNVNSLGTVLAYRMCYDRAAAAVSYPEMASSKFPSPTLAEAAVATPFLSVTFGARMASNTHLPSKGFVQSSPFVNFTAMGRKAGVEPTIRYAYPGVLHNVNSPFEYSFQGMKANSYLPEVGANNRGFIVTGFGSATGLSRCVIDELPGRPLASLAELQNWDARYENPVPPYSFNLVGNSDATPLIPSNAVINTAASTKGAENLQHDDSYCLNHILFDDWFFSSIAPEPVAFGRPSGSSTGRTTYANFVKDATQPLANRSYKPLPEDVSSVDGSASKATALANKNVGVTATSWKTIASRLEVEGMFNVNSTSVKAWRALLGHARNQQVPYLGSSGRPDLSGETDYPFSRFSVAGDVESKQRGASGPLTNCAEYAGYRTFDKAQLDFLAEEIVKQIRLRGPFLSLSEFVNRQLSSNDGLARAGAIQTALNQLQQSGQNPYSALEVDLTPDKLRTNTTSTDPPPAGTSGYAYAKAAEGFNVYGVPGWTRQADVLRPLAPVLSARDDTFTIRAYGDARDSTGNIVKARAVCEATIRRTREFVDPADDAANATLSTTSGTVPNPKALNALFGRRFEMVSFRWLSPDEV